MTARRRTLAIAGTIALVVLALAGIAAARPGGGESYSGGGGHSSSSRSGGGGSDSGAIFELIYWLIQLILWYPPLGLSVVAIILVYVVYNAYRQQRNKDLDSGPPVALEHAVELTALRRLDPAFSQFVFEDFAFRLFSTAHRARHTAEALAT